MNTQYEVIFDVKFSLGKEFSQYLSLSFYSIGANLIRINDFYDNEQVGQYVKQMSPSTTSVWLGLYTINTVFALIFFTYLPKSENLEKFSIYSSKFFHNFHFKFSFNCSGFRASELA